MADFVDVVALSLLPTWCWRTAGDLLRAGESSGDVLRQLWRLEIPVRELIPGDSSAATNGT